MIRSISGMIVFLGFLVLTAKSFAAEEMPIRPGVYLTGDSWTKLNGCSMQVADESKVLPDRLSVIIYDYLKGADPAGDYIGGGSFGKFFTFGSVRRQLEATGGTVVFRFDRERLTVTAKVSELGHIARYRIQSDDKSVTFDCGNLGFLPVYDE